MYNKNILIADDNIDLLEVYETLFSEFNSISKNIEEGFIVKTFETGIYLLEYFKEEVHKGNKIPLVILDMLMPGLDGLETGKLLRKIDSDVIIVIITAYPDKISLESIKAQLKEEIYYVPKPFRPKEIYCLVDSLLKSWNKKFQIKESEERYKVLFENTGTATCILEENHIISLANTKFQKLTGYTKEEIEGKKTWTEFVVKEDLEKMVYQHKLRRVSPHEALKNYEFRLIDKEGNIKNILLTVDLIPGTKKSVSSLMDITEWKQTEDALRKSEEKYRTIVENIFDIVYTYDINGKIMFISPRVSYYGYRPEEVIGHSFIEYVHPDDIEYVLSDYQRTIDKKVDTTTICRIITPRGMNYIEEISRPVVDKNGNIEYIIGVIRDITERKKTEEELHRIATAIEQAEETVLITDKDGTIQYVNPAFEKITGYKKDEVMGKKPSILKSGSHSNEFYSSMWETLEKGKVWKGRFINRKKDGNLYNEEATISPIMDNTGTITNYVGVKKDITKELKLEKQLNHIQKMQAIGTLAGGIAHDFNNILVAVLGYIQISRYDIGDTKTIQKNLDHMHRACERAINLVKQLLTFSRNTEGEKKPLYIGNIIKETLKFLRPLIPATIKIKENIKENSHMVIADPIHIHQIIMNLCNNAAYAMREKHGILEIILEKTIFTSEDSLLSKEMKSGTYIKLSISDTGHGMNQAIKERIFEPYFTTKKIGEGCGIGLSVVHGIVTSYGGVITVESKEGKGSTFHIFLPAIEYNVIPENIKPLTLPKGNERILFVDDEEDMVLEIAEKILVKLGYKVVTKTSSMEALEFFRKEPDKFDLIITDEIMPEMKGSELAKELLKIRPDIPVILTSGFIEYIDREKVRAIGIREFIIKPFDINNFAAIIRKVLKQNARL